MPQPDQPSVAETPVPAEQEIFLGRQPILDKAGNTAAYELLFRCDEANNASFVDGSLATATVINHAFANLGIESVLGSLRGFINFDTELLLGDLIELLPKDKIVIELLESIEVNDEVIKRVDFLKRQGYTLALDDYLLGDEIRKRDLFPLIDIVKVDIAGMSSKELSKVPEALRRFPPRLLAEKVDTHEQVASCRQLGFELFQGYYFARPSVITSRKLSPTTQTIMRLIVLVASDAASDKIEAVFRENPEMTVSLLRIVNSVAVGARQRITSIGHALMILGRHQLNRWLQVLMYALGNGPGITHPSPLTALASTRARFMELLSAELENSDTGLGERAFMVGMLSLTEALLGIRLEQTLAPLPLEMEVRDALLLRSGRLGELISLAEALEKSDSVAISKALAAFPGLQVDRVTQIQIKAMNWANSLGQSVSR